MDYCNHLRVSVQHILAMNFAMAEEEFVAVAIVVVDDGDGDELMLQFCSALSNFFSLQIRDVPENKLILEWLLS